jgi:hypothetical protein
VARPSKTEDNPVVEISPKKAIEEKRFHIGKQYSFQLSIWPDGKA